jgi:hypothetical protein
MRVSFARFRRYQNRYRIRRQRNDIVTELDITFRSQQEFSIVAQINRHALGDVTQVADGHGGPAHNDEPFRALVKGCPNSFETPSDSAGISRRS